MIQLLYQIPYIFEMYLVSSALIISSTGFDVFLLYVVEYQSV